MKQTLINRLAQSARRALRNAYSPYSKVKVGAAVMTDTGHIYSGCNVENASYGGTICAERTAVCNAIAGGAKRIKSIYVTTNQTKIWPPCGLCRQVLAEFSTPETVIYCANKNGQMITSTFAELFPGSFDRSFLK